MKLMDYQKPKNLPGWLEKILLSRQRDAISRSFYKLEATEASKFFEEHQCKNLIDIGVWTGVLSYEIRKRIKSIDRHILIDAVPAYLYTTKSLFENEKLLDNSEVVEMYISDLMQKYVTVNLENMIDKSKPNDDTLFNVNFPLAPTVSIEDSVQKVIELAGSDCYLKIDINDPDNNLINKLLDINFYPRVIHFKSPLFTPNQIIICLALLEKLEKAGYKVPELSDLFGKKTVTIISSRKDLFVLPI